MKRSILKISAALILLFGLLSSCGIMCEEGSGHMIKNKRKLVEFSSISLRGAAKVYITQGNTQSLEIEADDNIIDLIETYVKGNKLIISNKNFCFRNATIKIYITLKYIDAIALAGSGDIIGKNTILTDHLDISVSGSGNVKLNLKADKIESHITGSGTIYLVGKTKSNKSKISGSGDLRAFELETSDTEITIGGSGSARINVTEKLDAYIYGSGDIRYSGKPEDVNQTVRGSGSVRKR
ncbi:head GIN domain-containing protein [Bacteroidota bacterium]